jgi:hypothetical protein
MTKERLQLRGHGIHRMACPHQFGTGHLTPRGSMILDTTGLPRYWVSAWATLQTGDLAESTVRQQLSQLDSLYDHADDNQGFGSLDDAIAAQDLDFRKTMVEGYFVSIWNRPTVTATGQVRWQTAVRFVMDILRITSHGAATASRLSELKVRLARFETLYGQLSIGQHRKVEPVRSLPASVLEELYTILDRDSTRNPFRKGASRWRVYVEYVVMLHLALRRGELLTLPVDAVKSQFDPDRGRQVFWCFG